jgi:hypothetical protein
VKCKEMISDVFSYTSIAVRMRVSEKFLINTSQTAF